MLASAGDSGPALSGCCVSVLLTCSGHRNHVKLCHHRIKAKLRHEKKLSLQPCQNVKDLREVYSGWPEIAIWSGGSLNDPKSLKILILV